MHACCLPCRVGNLAPLPCDGAHSQNILPNGPISWVFKMVVDDQMW